MKFPVRALSIQTLALVAFSAVAAVAFAADPAPANSAVQARLDAIEKMHVTAHKAAPKHAAAAPAKVQKVLDEAATAELGAHAR